MLENILQQIENELSKSVRIKGHPFRFFTLGTIQSDSPCLRTVVLRSLKDNFRLVFYTDSRSQKVQQLNANRHCCALFYHPKKLMQLKIEGTALLHSNGLDKTELWNSIPDNSRKDYITQSPPGSTLVGPDQVDYLQDENYFLPVMIVPQRIEYLKLKRPNHIRAVFDKNEDGWLGSFLVP